MTRILRIIETASPHYGGPIEGARRFGEIWAQAGHRQDLLTLDPPEENHLPDYPGTIHRIGPPRGRTPWRRYRYAPAMVPWVRAHAARYDAVIVSGLWRYMARGALKGLAGGPIPYFVFVHGMLDPWFRRTHPVKHIGKQLSWWWAEGPLIGGAAATFFTSEEERLLAHDAFWPYHARPAVVNYGTRDACGDPQGQIAAFRAAVPALGERSFLLFLSRIHPKKGCDLLIEAFAALAARAPDLDLVLAGPDQVGLAIELQRQAERLGLTRRVHFPGMLEGDAKAGAYRAADAFVLPSHQENFGIVVAEAMAHATPVLISDKVNIWREVAADGAGLIAPDNVEGTRAMIARFLDMTQAERGAMAERSRASFLARFDVQRAAASLMALIEHHVRQTGH